MVCSRHFEGSSYHTYVNSLLKVFQQILLLRVLPKDKRHCRVELRNYQGKHLHYKRSQDGQNKAIRFKHFILLFSLQRHNNDDDDNDFNSTPCNDAMMIDDVKPLQAELS